MDSPIIYMPGQKQYIYIKVQWYISVASLMCCSVPCVFWFIGEQQSCRQELFFSSHQRQLKANSRLWWGHESNIVTDRTIFLLHDTVGGTQREYTARTAAGMSCFLILPPLFSPLSSFFVFNFWRWCALLTSSLWGILNQHRGKQEERKLLSL